MNQTQTIQYAERDDRIYLRIYLLLSKKGGGWPSFGALIGLVGGLLSVPLASLLWAMSKFIGPVEIGQTLNILSNILFAVTLPLLTLGACCLDLLEYKFPTTPSGVARQSISKAGVTCDGINRPTIKSPASRARSVSFKQIRDSDRTFDPMKFWLS